MKRWMKRLMVLLLILLLLFQLSVAAFADIGPKRSVRVTIDGLEGQQVYGTLLSERNSTGPYSAYELGYSKGDDEPGGEEIWRAFVDYEDSDGFWYLQRAWDLSEENEISWTYHPPTVFKLLLYFPESGEFVVSPIYEQYAFHSYFAVTYENGELAVEKNYPYGWELVSLAARIVLTIAVELLIALPFGYRAKEQLAYLMKVNCGTQILLNVALNFANFAAGPWAFGLWYIILEFAVFGIEAGLYRKLKGHSTWYAFVANTLSFALGWGLAHWIPGIF